jgi:hypothetical protein
MLDMPYLLLQAHYTSPFLLQKALILLSRGFVEAVTYPYLFLDSAGTT